VTEQAAVAAGADAAPQRRVLVAEDEALIRLDLVEMLQEEGYQVVGEAGDGEEAIKLANDLKPDLVILDVKMPKLDGIEAASKITSDRVAPVVILTAFSQRDLVERARDAGTMAYLVKPFAKRDLVPAIELAVSRFAELQALESEVAGLTDRLETRKVIDRAGPVRTRCLPLDPAHRDGPPHDHEGRRGSRRREHRLTPGPTTHVTSCDHPIVAIGSLPANAALIVLRPVTMWIQHRV
jgi:AmiR/NasT family two-component response regulator